MALLERAGLLHELRRAEAVVEEVSDEVVGGEAIEIRGFHPLITGRSQTVGAKLIS